jgi:prepilin-type N-terminal cleavage/methylation domain-containing protein
MKFGCLKQGKNVSLVESHITPRLPMLKKAFTLVEVLLVIVLIAVLSGITIIAVSPKSALDESNDLRVKVHLDSLGEAIYQYSIDNLGLFPMNIGGVRAEIRNGVGFADICSALVPEYLPSMPFDEADISNYYNDCSDYKTGYFVHVDATTRRLVLYHPLAAEGPIEVIR